MELQTIILSNLNRLKIFTGKFLGKFVVKRILKLPPHHACVATLPCETLLSAKQAMNDELQGIVARAGQSQTLAHPTAPLAACVQ